MKYLGLEIDYSRDQLFDELGLKRLRESYMKDDENSPQERFAFVSKAFGSNEEHSQRLYEYSSKHWLSYATPILSFGRTKYGLPISCYLSWIPDTAKGLVDTLSETNWLSMLGGGVGLGFGIRSSGDKSTGVMPHLKTYDASSLAYRQGNCYVPGTEILTSSGWKAMEFLQKDDVVAVIDDDGSISFENPLEIVTEKYNGNIIRFTNKSRGIEISVTEDHSMVVERKIKSGWSKRLEKVRASELKFHNEVRFWTAAKPTGSISSLDPLTRLKIAIQADGHIRTDGVCEFHLKKERKISRINEILSSLGLETWQGDHKDGTVSVYAKGMSFDGLKSLSWIDLSKVTQQEAAAMLEEIAEWDSTRNREHSFIYSSSIRENASIVQSLAVIAGRPSRISNRKRQAPRLDMHSVFVGSKNYFLLEKLKRENIQYNGMVHCCLVRTGKIVVRAGETPIICGNTRRGSYAAYLDISHPDVIMFLDMRRPTGDQNMRCLNLHHGINITDSFMKIIEKCMLDPNADDKWELKDPHSGVVKEVVSAKEIWQKILELRVQTGEPYIHFIDTSNKYMPDYLKDKGLKIRQSNLCVSGDQRVPSNLGMITAKELYDIGSELTLASNNGPVKATAMKLVEKDAETFTVSLENGMTHTVTRYHKILTRNGRSSVPKALSELSVGDYIAVQTNEGVFGNIDMQKEAFLLGMYHGDGTQSNKGKTIHFDVWENDFDLCDEIESNLNYIYEKYSLSKSHLCRNQFSSGSNRIYTTPKFSNCNTGFSNVKKKRLTTTALSEVLEFKKGMIPSWIWSGTKETQWNYIRGLLYTDGTAFVSKSKGNPIQINIASIDRSHLKNIQLILANLGVQTSIRMLRAGGLTKLPDGNGGLKNYKTQDCYRVIIGNKNDAIKVEEFTGFLKRKNISIDKRVYRDNTKKFYKISSIEPAGRQDVYCVGVHTEQHLWICNGVVTHNCSEILLPTSEERTAVCCLSSLNLELYNEWSNNEIFLRDVAEMLDNVLDYFIANAPDEIMRAKFSASRERSIGIGALGFHAFLQRNKIPFESALAKSANIRMFKKIREGLDKANEALALERGEAPDAVGTGKRFSHLMAIAPNACVIGDTKILMGDGSTLSIEEIGVRLGVDMKSLEHLNVDLDDGTTIELHIGQEILIKRDGKNIKIIASELYENDEIIEVLR